jgi:hypothetical protein
MHGPEEGDMSGNKKGELDGQGTVIPITYSSSLTLRVTTPTGQINFALCERVGVYREI